MEAAIALIEIVEYLETSPLSKIRVHNVGVSLIRRFLSHSTYVESLEFEPTPTSDPEFLYRFCYRLITEVPDSGNTPQKIAAFLFESYHEAFSTGITVSGTEDSAFVTSTTGKKAGDICEDAKNGEILKVYEITVKPFLFERIQQSYDSIQVYNAEKERKIDEIIVICRKKDCPKNIKLSGLHGFLGHYIYRDVIYYFWDIFEWIANTLQRMPQRGRLRFYLKLHSYVCDTNTSEKVKLKWRELNLQ